MGLAWLQEVPSPVQPLVPKGALDISQMAVKYTKGEAALDSPVDASSFLSPSQVLHCAQSPWRSLCSTARYHTVYVALWRVLVVL